VKSAATIVIIGSGNVATCFGKAFVEVGMNVMVVYSHQIDHAKNLAEQLNTKAVSSLNEIPTNADFYFLAVKDSVIKDVSEQIHVSGIVIHFSGNTSIDILDKHKNYGVIWPLQTLTKNFQPDFKSIPLCLEGNNETSLKSISELTSTISEKVVMMNSTQRKYAHLAAVIANNFSNRLFEISAQILKDHDLDFEILHPIILETASKIQHANPAEMQTGPAVREDIKTINEQMEMLNEYPEFRNMYEVLSKSIINQNKSKK
jgi:predicted short-subunit dehydrogenase-like oxidoreductase (DUF2520 family)